MRKLEWFIPIAASFCIGWFSAGISKQSTINHREMKKVTSIGGIFFKCKNPALVREWYSRHLGFNTDEYGTNFEWRHADDSSQAGFTLWAPFKNNSLYFEPSQKDFMINYRVENLQSLVEELKKEGVQVLDEIQVFEYGSFVHLIDIEGNKVELWEPKDKEYDKIVEGRTK
jgi:predicted enzyme related to lactoylglutathione lyase